MSHCSFGSMFKQTNLRSKVNLQASRDSKSHSVLLHLMTEQEIKEREEKANGYKEWIMRTNLRLEQTLLT